jgi:hypothetical protein
VETLRIDSLAIFEYDSPVVSYYMSRGAELAMAPSTTCGNFNRNIAASIPPYEPPTATTVLVGVGLSFSVMSAKSKRT